MIISLAGNDQFQVPRASPQELATSTRWYRRQRVDKAAPLSKQLAPVDTACRGFEPDACFAAGTLVHTKEGLKPIEQIKVGDWVLSKPENGGAQAYKRVVKTFAHEPQRVVELCYYKPTNKPSQRPGNVARITVTVNHPVWTKERGWTAVDGLRSVEDGLPHFEDKDGDDVKFRYIQNIYLSDQPNVGWTSNHWPDSMRGYGSLWDYAEHRLVASEAYALEDISFEEHPDPYFKAPVYNLEVEDFHTYYVGEHGIWVHNQNCGGLSIEVRNTAHPIPAAADGTMGASVSRPIRYLGRGPRHSEGDDLLAMARKVSLRKWAAAARLVSAA